MLHACKRWDCHSDVKIEIKEEEEDQRHFPSECKEKHYNHHGLPHEGLAVLGACHVATKTLDCGRFLGNVGWHQW